MKRFERTISPCVNNAVFNGTLAHKLTGHFIHNLVFTKRILMIPTKTASGVMDSPQSGA